MLVRDIMQSKLITIDPKTTLPQAMRLAAERRIRHLPVVQGGDLIGIVSDRDLKQAMASPATSLEAHELNYLLNRLTVAEIMTRTVITIGPTIPVEEAARLMVQEKISALPVTEAGQLIGIVTETDVLELVVRALGAGTPSTRLGVPLEERPSALVDIVKAIEGAGAPIASIVTLTSRAGLREAVVRVATLDPTAAVAALEARGFAVRESCWRG
jgi:acetoin utilization protein AcuB